ncbi:MAG: hypothetical protein IJO78_05185 [Erysipelotrichaceae bacterium]|nr:hypothetical protein [Erysipelotrichaceae bacterium]MBQ9840968.1 hypothetical protein [Erysipelotrichaceae bacterium]
MKTKRKIMTMDENYIRKHNLPNEYLGKMIVVYKERYAHFAKHQSEFLNYSSYDYSVKSLDDIIQNPEFIVYDSKNNSLEFVKKLLDNTLVAVRVADCLELKVKTLYPINDIKKDKLKKKSFTYKL